MHSFSHDLIKWMNYNNDVSITVRTFSILLFDISFARYIEKSLKIF